MTEQFRPELFDDSVIVNEKIVYFRTVNSIDINECFFLQYSYIFLYEYCWGTCKMRSETRNEIYRNQTKRNQTRSSSSIDEMIDSSIVDC